MGGGPLNGLREPSMCRIPNYQPRQDKHNTEGDDEKHKQEKRKREREREKEKRSQRADRASD